MPAPANKRRRIEVANATLRKPFKSPIVGRPVKGDDEAKTDKASRTAPSPLKKSFDSQEATVTKAAGERDGTAAEGGEGNDAREDGPDAPSTSPVRAHKRPQRAKVKKEDRPADKPASGFVWKEQRHELEARNLELESEIARLRDESAAHPEADASTVEKGDELDDLVEKWKAAARQAAEELFEISKSRIRNMGGMKEMKAMQKRQAEFFNQFDESPTRRKASQDSDEGYEVASPPPQESQEEEAEELTMGAMLRSLNIEFEEIGYDEAEDRWKD